jgi:hypothetical protein
MSLQDRLNELKTKFESTAPKDALEIMHRATEELRNSGIMDRMLEVGETVPEFELNNAHGKLISLKGLLSKGPLVLSFYRGKW